jgi:hypothetical protein
MVRWPGIGRQALGQLGKVALRAVRYVIIQQLPQGTPGRGQAVREQILSRSGLSNGGSLDGSQRISRWRSGISSQHLQPLGSEGPLPGESGRLGP